MSYVSKTLAPGEEILHRANYNWTYSFFPVMWFSISVVAITFVAMVEFAGGVAHRELLVAWWSAYIGLGAGFMVLLFHMVHLATTEIVITTYRFVFKTGLISRRSQEVSLNKIEEISLEQSVWGRFMGFGKLVLRGTGVGLIELPDLDSPIALRRIIEGAKANLRDEAPRPPSATTS